MTSAGFSGLCAARSKTRAQATDRAAELPRPMAIGRSLLTATLTFGLPQADAARLKA